VISLLLFSGCSSEDKKDNRVIIGISADVETINPLYAFSVDEGNITELLFMSLIQYDWNSVKGQLDPYPMLAEKWEWEKDSSSITLKLRENVYWTDSTLFTANDVVFSYDVYSDPSVQSRMYGSFDNYYKENDGSIDIEKSFDVISDHKIKVNFKPNSNPTFLDIDLPLVTESAFEDIQREDYSTAETNFKPVTNGPYKLSRWDREEMIVLKARARSFLHKESTINEIVFKIIPDYTARVLQLKQGAIDLLEEIKPEDVKSLKPLKNINVKPIEGREYDYIGWNNISPDAYKKSSEIKPHRLFGSEKVRIALTHAINRRAIIKEYLQGYGQLAVTPISPIFKKAYNHSLKPYEYDIEEAKTLLEQAGWIDSDNDGILEKNGEEFIFTLNIPSGNPRREYAATVIKNDLKKAGIEVTVRSHEMGVFIDNLHKKRFDAWMVGSYIPIPIHLKSFWYSDLSKAPVNFVSYQNNEVDKIINEIENTSDETIKNQLYKKFQKIIHQEQPVTFLYWIDNITAHNKKINNMDISPLGFIHHCWNWTIEE
jgi:peptide/nickel transport system substrate-binding protein